MASCLWSHQRLIQSHHRFSDNHPLLHHHNPLHLVVSNTPRRTNRIRIRISCSSSGDYDDSTRKPPQPQSSSSGIQLYTQIERYIYYSKKKKKKNYLLGSHVFNTWFQITYRDCKTITRWLGRFKRLE